MGATRPSTYICRSCVARQRRAASSSTFSHRPSALDAGFAHLPSRQLLAIHGHDAAHFLQGLTTANIPTSGLLSSPSNPQVLYSAFMNAQGRLLHDVFIYPLHPQHALRERITGSRDEKSDPAFLVEVDSGHAKTLQGFLRKYKLRAKLTIRALEDGELKVYGAWRKGDTGAPPGALVQRNEAGADLLITSDPRLQQQWHRILALQSDGRRISQQMDLPQATERMYTLQRYLNGIAEGQQELPREETLLHEANVDLMQGVDFRKGCYVGQELVIRTQHTGVIRKRVMPLQIWTDGPPSQAEVEIQEEPVFTGRVEEGTDGIADVRVECSLASMIGQNIRTKGAKRPEGRLLGGLGNVGLGLCRLERVLEMEDSVAKGRTRVLELEIEDGKKTWIRPFVPKWWMERGKVMEGGYESLKAKAPGGRS